MSAKANLIAREFTQPIIISSITHSGQCNSGIGTYVVINEDGWFVTAFHIIEQISKLVDSVKQYEEVLKRRKEIEQDETKNVHVKKGLLRKIEIKHDAVSNFSAWLGNDLLGLGIVHVLPEIDLAIGQLANFNKDMIKIYPVFKDYTKPMDNGTSLCKLGYPFHSIVPTFDNISRNFILPNGALPMPLFPLDGIYTRTVEVKHPNPQITIPLKYIETSSPGLRGQSGGPTFDTNGTVWAIQSQTKHYPLGFGQTTSGLSNKAAEHLQNQYLNVGLGVHSETIIEFCKINKVAIQLSDY